METRQPTDAHPLAAALLTRAANMDQDVYMRHTEKVTEATKKASTARVASYDFLVPRPKPVPHSPVGQVVARFPEQASLAPCARPCVCKWGRGTGMLLLGARCPPRGCLLHFRTTGAGASAWDFLMRDALSLLTFLHYWMPSELFQ